MSNDPIIGTRMFRAGKSPNFVWVLLQWQDDVPHVTLLPAKLNLEFLIWGDVSGQIQETQPDVVKLVEAAIKVALRRKADKRAKIRKTLRLARDLTPQ
ncbi:hypothetical protein HYV31_00970 [candidate division WWE3 bacterium]|nr:hypothetical protein [candidate division WWE3 bacterium]